MGVSDEVPPAPPNGLAEVKSVFGDPGYLPPGRVDPRWEAEFMRKVYDLPLVGHVLYVNKLIVDPLRRALAACSSLRDGYVLHTIGCFAPRAQRGSNGAVLSLHTWGIAVDLNPEQNPLIAPCPPDDPRRRDRLNYNLPDAWIDAFKRAGFFWGGDFHNRFDSMHFQFATGC